jgi:hypothetical protein
VTLLPFHFRKLGTLRPAVLFWILLIPLISGIAAIELFAPQRPQAPFGQGLDEFSNLLAIPPERLAELTNVPLVLVIFAVGYSLGWLLNLVVLMMVRRSSLSAVTRIVAAGIVPPEWERTDAREKLAAARARDRGEWIALQKRGVFRHIVLRGGLMFGSVCFVGINLVLPLVSLRPIATSSLPIWFLIWAFVGVALASFGWVSLKLSQRSEA